MSVEFGLVMPAGPPKTWIGWWRDMLDTILPSLGGYFRSLWMTDHLMWGDDPTYEAWTVLAYMAARWPQFTLGPVVLGQSYRNPAMLAKMAATLQTLSRGNFVMGIGAGWKEDEYHAYGYEYPRPGIRVAQLEDTLEIMTRLWTEPGQVTYEGKHYSVKDAYCEPKPDPVPTIMVGGGGTKTTRLAARFADWWSLPDANWDVYSARLAVARQHCEDLDRDPASLRATWFGRLVVRETEAEALEAGGGKWTPENAFVGTPSQVIAQMQPFVEADVDYFMVEVLGLPNHEVVQMVIAEIMPALEAIRS